MIYPGHFCHFRSLGLISLDNIVTFETISKITRCVCSHSMLPVLCFSRTTCLYMIRISETVSGYNGYRYGDCYEYFSVFFFWSMSSANFCRRYPFELVYISFHQPPYLILIGLKGGSRPHLSPTVFFYKHSLIYLLWPL